MKSDLFMDDLDEEQRAELRAKRREARKEMERERKKAVRAAYKRLKDSKTKKTDVSDLMIQIFAFFVIFHAFLPSADFFQKNNS